MTADHREDGPDEAHGGGPLDEDAAHSGPEAGPVVGADVARDTVFESEHRLDVTVVEDALERAGLQPTTTKLVQDTTTLFAVSVPAAEAASARDIVTALYPEPVPVGAPQATAVGVTNKRTTLAWGLALVPGMAHVYAGATLRGLVLFGALLSTRYWARFDHMVVVAPVLLMLVDALGATALIRGRSTPLRAALAWTSPLWLASPALLLRAAPDVYIGGSGRTFCAHATECGITFEEESCGAVLARQIGGSIRFRRAIGDCARHLETRSCDEAYGPSEDELDEDEGEGEDAPLCETPPMCARGHSVGEEACIQVYYGLPDEGSGPRNWRTSQPRGWGM